MSTGRLIAILASNIGLTFAQVAAQQWVPLGPDDANWPSVGWAESQTLALDANGYPVVMSSDLSLGGWFGVVRWDGAKWRRLGTDGFFPPGSSLSGMVMDDSGAPLVAGSDPTFGSRISVKRWNGSSWQPFGQSGFSSGGVSGIGLEVGDSGSLIVAYVDLANDERITVQRWNGTGWQVMGQEGFTNSNAYSLQLALDADGLPYVAYNDWPNGHHTKVQRWNGSEWELLDMSTFPAGTVQERDLVVDADGHPMLAIRMAAFGNRMTVLRWSGTAWAILGGESISEGQASVNDFVLDGEGKPVVLYWDQMSGLQPAMRWNGETWEQLWTLDATAGAGHPRLTFDTNGTPVVAFQANWYGGRTMVQRWDGSGWRALGEEGFSQRWALFTSMAIDSAGKVWVVYSDRANNYRAAVQQWDGESWEPAGEGQLSTTDAYYLDIALDSLGFPVVAGWGIGDVIGVSAARWNGTSWNLIGSPVLDVGYVSGLRLALDEVGNPVVAYLVPTNFSGINNVRVKRWTGSAWLELAPAPGIYVSNKLGLVLDASGNPTIAFRTASPDGTVAMRWNGASWNMLGYQMPYVTFLDLDRDAMGNPVLACAESSAITIRRWEGASWSNVCPPGEIGSDVVCLDMDSADNPVVGFATSGGATVRRWNGATWEGMGPASFTTPFTSFAGPRWLQVGSDGRIVVAFPSGAMYAKAFTPENGGIVSFSGHLNIGPNPNAGDGFWISMAGLPVTFETVEIQLLDMSGRRVDAQTLPVRDGELNARIALPPALADGLYVASLAVEGKRYSSKVVVAKQ